MHKASPLFGISPLFLIFLGNLISNPGYCDFIWPKKGELNSNNLKSYVERYSKEVESCLDIERKNQTEEQKAWCDVRVDLWKDYQKFTSTYLAPIESLADIQTQRDTFCKKIKENFVDKKHLGKQFGNCGEGAYVLYCLAHEAGYENLLFCNSEEDHGFSIFLDTSEAFPKICVLDRFNLGNGHYFCGVTLQNNQLKEAPSDTAPKLDLSHKWYSKLDCTDPLNKVSKLTTADMPLFNALKWQQSFNHVQYQVTGQDSPKEIEKALKLKYPDYEVELANIHGAIVIKLNYKEDQNIQATLQDLHHKKLDATVIPSIHEIVIHFKSLPELKKLLLFNKSKL